MNSTRFRTSLGLAVIILCTAIVPISAAQTPHPAFTPPSAFASASPSERERIFVRKLGNGDQLRIHVMLQQAGADPLAIAKGPALGEGDQIRDETKQDVQNGKLTGVAFSCLGKSETIDGIVYTRYRRVMGLALAGVPEPFALQADLLCKEPRPAQSTIEAMLTALVGWQNAIGGGGGDAPPEPSNGGAASKPVIGGDTVVSLTNGGDLEIRVPNYWGRANLKFSDGHEEIILGPAKEVVAAVTVDSIAKDKDRIGPSITITRMQRDTFKDLIDIQILDIADSLLADYVARMSEAGRTLTMGEREDGTLGTRTVISVPFEEKRSSGTQYKGRAVFMMHRGSLVVVTASHPVEHFDEGWPDIAKAFDTLVFTGAPEAAPGTPDKPDGGTPPPEGGQPAGGNTTPPVGTNPAGQPTGQPVGQPVGQPIERPVAPPTLAPPPTQPLASGALHLPPAPPDWLKETKGALRTVALPTLTPIQFQMPAAWSLFGEFHPFHEALSFVATPNAATALDPTQSVLRVEYFGFLEELANPTALGRLAALMRLRLEQDARGQGALVTVRSEDKAGLSGLPAIVLQYGVKGGDREANGTLVGTTFDGTVVLVDLRLSPADGGQLGPAAGEILNTLRISLGADITRQSFGNYSLEVPADWTANDGANAGGGRDIFLQAPTSGVTLRLQTAVQKRPEVVTTEILRTMSEGFLVKGLSVLSVRDLGAARRLLVPGARSGLRFDSQGQEVGAMIFAYVAGNDVVFALRGAPRGYRGRDLAVAYRLARSFMVPGQDPRPAADPPPISGAAFSARVVFSRDELDAVGPDGAARPQSTRYIACLPDGSAGVVVERGGKKDNLRATYHIEGGGTVVIEGPGIGKLVYQFAEEGESLRGEQPGDVLFRTRHEEFP